MRSMWAVLIVVALAVASSAPGATVCYRMLIDGKETGSGPTGGFTAADITPGTWFRISVEANCQDMLIDPAGPTYGGIVGFQFDMQESPANGLAAKESLSIAGAWDSTTAVQPLGGPGSVLQPGYEVYQHSGYAFPAENFGSSFGAGPGVWTEICGGYFKWDGSTDAELALIPAGAEYHVVWNGKTGEYPTKICGDRIGFGELPEPTSLLFLAVGGLASLRRGRRRE